MYNSDKIAMLISETIDNEINDFIDSNETHAVMYGYYSATVECIKHYVNAFGRADAAHTLVHAFPTFCAHDADEDLCDSAPLLLLRDHLEDYCREHLLPEEDSAYYNAIDIALDNMDWCCLAEDMERDFCDPDNK